MRLAANAAVDAATAEPMLQIPSHLQGRPRVDLAIAPAPAPASRSNKGAPVNNVTQHDVLSNCQEERAQDLLPSQDAQDVIDVVDDSDHSDYKEGELTAFGE